MVDVEALYFSICGPSTVFEINMILVKFKFDLQIV